MIEKVIGKDIGRMVNYIIKVIILMVKEMVVGKYIIIMGNYVVKNII